MEDKLHIFLTSTLHVVCGQFHALATLPPEKEPPVGLSPRVGLPFLLRLTLLLKPKMKVLLFPNRWFVHLAGFDYISAKFERLKIK
jgi:hypothetical protein